MLLITDKTTLCIVTLPIKIGLVTIPTLVHVMQGPLSYNLLLGRLWIHALGAVSSTLHGSIKFVANNQVVTIKVDPEAMHLCQVVAARHALVTTTFKIYIPFLSSNMLTTTHMDPPKEKTHEKVVPKEDPPKIESPKSTPSQSNAFLTDDWGSLDFTSSFIGEYKVNPIRLNFPKVSFTPAIKDDYSFVSQDHVNTIGYTIKGDPPPLEELQSCYDPGFNIASNYGYKGNGLGRMGQGVKVPLESKLHSFIVGLGYKASPLSKSPSFSNVPMSSSSCEQSNSSPQEKGLVPTHPLFDQELLLLWLLKACLISLPLPTHKKFHKDNNEKHYFYAYHQVLGHSTSECNALTDKIQLVHQLGLINSSSIDAPSSSSLHNK